MNTGEFDQLTFVDDMRLLAGDIMWRSGHTAIITESDPSYSKDPKWVASALTYCSVYRSPSTSSDLLTEWPHLGTGNLVDVCDEAGDFWYVRIAGQYFGFVLKDCLSAAPSPEPFKKFIGAATTQLNMRTGPAATYPYCYFDRNDGKGKRHTIQKGEEVLIINEENGWYECEIGGKDQTWNPWCSAKYIVKVRDYDDIVVGDEIVFNGNQLEVSESGLSGKVIEIFEDKYKIELSDGCVGWTVKEELKK